MGLETTHGCWEGPYEGFNRWRDALAYVSGFGSLFDLVRTYEDAPPPEGTLQVAGEGGFPFRAADPLADLLFHSDCEGEIPISQCLPLAARLEQLAPLLSDDVPVGVSDGYRQATLQFAAGLRAAAAAGEPVLFH